MILLIKGKSIQINNFFPQLLHCTIFSHGVLCSVQVCYKRGLSASPDTSRLCPGESHLGRFGRRCSNVVRPFHAWLNLLCGPGPLIWKQLLWDYPLAWPSACTDLIKKCAPRSRAWLPLSVTQHKSSENVHGDEKVIGGTERKRHQRRNKAT